MFTLVYYFQVMLELTLVENLVGLRPATRLSLEYQIRMEVNGSKKQASLLRHGIITT